VEPRVNVSWGGFNVVRATLFGLEEILRRFDGEFDWIATLSGYTYPLASNRRIRDTLASFPRDTEFMEIRPQPNDPQPRAWHQYVECDNAMRRIYRLWPPDTIKMYMGSQWMIVTRDFARYVVGDSLRAAGRRRAFLNAKHANTLAPSDLKFEPPVASFAQHYERYAQYTMVADENFFVTVLKNSPLCHRHHNENFLHVQFDKWENEKPSASANKCLQPNPRHCGRSPTTLTVDYLPVLELGGALFARKFVMRRNNSSGDESAARVLDAIDARRKAEDDAASETPAPIAAPPVFDGVRIAWRPHHLSGAPRTELCVAVAPEEASKERSSSNKAPIARDVRLRPCDAVDPLQRFALGPCSTDGAIELAAAGPARVTPGAFAPAPFCPIVAEKTPPRSDSSSSKPQRPLCLDLEREHITPGTTIIAYPCTGRWNQLFAFGTGLNGKPAPGAVYVDIPYPYHVPKELCLEAVLEAEDTRDGGTKASSSFVPALKVHECDGTKLEQLFHVEYAPPVPHVVGEDSNNTIVAPPQDDDGEPPS